MVLRGLSWAVSAILLLSVATVAQADLFRNLYAAAKPVPKSVAVPQANSPTTGAQCVAAILDAERRYGIPDNLLLAIGVQEAGRNGPAGLAVWPWTANANGEGAFFKSRVALQEWVRQKQAEGINSIDVGCMQINLRWHGDQFPSQDAAFDPQANVDYAARFLVALFHETGDWTEAAGRYHSATDEHQQRYLSSLARNQKVVAQGIDRLIALARSYVPQQQAQVAQVHEPQAPPPPVFWSGAESGSFSIYSNTPIRPMLPNYKEFF